MPNEAKSNQQNQADDSQPNQSPKKVVPSTQRVENVNKPQNPSGETRDMGDVVARDSAAKDGVKQSP